MGLCYSHRKSCSLGPLPPRTPARPDPQVPSDHKLGPALHGAIGSFYFYEEGSQDDPAFGFFDIELSVQYLSDRQVRVEVYCVADGYQSSRGVGAEHPLRILVLSNGETVATAEWHFPDVICGHADPMNYSQDVPIVIPFGKIDSVALDKVEGLSAPCR